MRRPFKKKKSFRDSIDDRLDHLTDTTGDLVKQASERAPELRDQLLGYLPDRQQLLDMRDDVVERLPDQVSDKLPESAQPAKPKKKSRLKKLAIVGAVTGAGAAAYAFARGKMGTTADPVTEAPVAATPPTTAPTPAAKAAAPAPAAPAKKATPAAKKAPAKKSASATKTAAAKKSAPKNSAAPKE